MRKILKLTLLLSFTLVTQNQFWHNLVFERGIETIIKVALILSIFEIIIKPILRLLLLPITFITFGLIKIVVATLGLYLCLFLLADFHLNEIHTGLTSLYGINIPALNFTGFWAVFINSISNSFLLGFFRLLIKPKKDKK